MIRIDNISFGFTAADEQFAHELYADWNSFCHTCVEEIIAECLSVYDKEKVLYEIELLDLDLGSIPEENIYQEFPRRLREELQRALPLLNISAESRQQNTSISRLENLLFYLEYGYPKTEWSDESFNLAEELRWIATQASSCINKISKLCLSKENALRRLFWQADDEVVFLRLYVAALSEPAASLYEKRRFLVMLLEVKPDIPVRFIHIAESDTALQDMAELLDTVSVRRIMETETGEHTEVDLPPYWHYLYEWLIRYYPFNGLAIFGGKSDFIRHLHHRLLTFIQKQTYSFYFSKADLTVGFLLEVFGSTYYIEVLNAIYNLQPHNSDGSPVHDNYFNRELYRMFLNLSLLRLPLAEEGRKISSSEKEKDRHLTDISTLAAFLKERKDKEQFAETHEASSSVAYIRKLQTILADGSIPETVKRRMITLYLEQYAENYMNAILLLHKENLLSFAVHLISRPALEEIIRQSVVRMGGEYLFVRLLPLLYWLLAHERVVSVYLLDRTTELKVQLLVWLAKVVQSQTDVARTVEGNLHSLLETLFVKENIHSVIAGISRDNDSNIVQTLLKSSWNTDRGFSNWLEDTTVSLDNKRDLLQRIVVEQPLYWIHLLRQQPVESKAVPFLSASLSVSLFLQSMAQADSRQASVLSQTMEWMQSKINDYPFLTGGSTVYSTAFSQALLLYMLDTETLGGRRLTEKETVHKFLSYLHLIYTGKPSYQDNAEWVGLSGMITTDMKWDNWQDMQEKKIADVLSHKEMEDTAFCQYITSIIDKQPEQLLAWLEKDTGTDKTPITRIAGISDVTMLKQWTAFLPAVTGFENPGAFRQLMAWLIGLATNRTSVADMIEALFLWIRETDWRKQTPEQMEDYFLSRLFIKNNTELLPLEQLSDRGLPENVRKKLLYRYIRFQPKELLDYISRSVAQNILPLDKWLILLNINDWMQLATNLSLSQAELLQQIIDCLSKSGQAKKADLQQALAAYLIENTKKWIYNSKEETVHSFVQSFPALQEKMEDERNKIEHNVKQILNIMEGKLYFNEEEQREVPNNFFITNAGLCLFNPWFPRLFVMLDYLDKDKKAFKDTASQIRAVFLLQYLTCLEEKTYQEMELVFNRLLVNLPMHIPLPKQLELTYEEKNTADSLIKAVKANWRKMDGTSMRGFQETFIHRNGRLEQQKEKWLLTIEERGYDILLESVPWSFKQIRYPWLENYIQVIWHDKQTF